MKVRISLFLSSILFLSSCSDKYLSFKEKYQFRSSDGKPDYSNLDYWAAHPWKWDPSDSIPKPLKNEVRDSLVDVFFLHPTTLTKKSLFATQPNAVIDDDYLNAKTDYSSMLYQATVFNQQCRVFAPRYRQAHIENFFSNDTSKSNAAYVIAYTDIKAAFEFYLKNFNKGRPIIIAGHSQGGFMAERLLKEFFEGKPLYNKLVVAYIAGWPIPKTYFSSLEICTDSTQTGCLCSWRTFKNGFVPFYLKKENGNSFVTNPITWTTGTELASRKLNKGSVLTKFNKIYKHSADAQIRNGLLYTRKPKFPWSFLITSKNYHVGDINLYYMNIRENINRRIAMYWK